MSTELCSQTPSLSLSTGTTSLLFTHVLRQHTPLLSPFPFCALTFAPFTPVGRCICVVLVLGCQSTGRRTASSAHLEKIQKTPKPTELLQEEGQLAHCLLKLLERADRNFI